MNTGKLKLARLMQQFEVHNRSEGKAEKTVLWYNQALGLFRDWLISNEMSTCVEDLGEEEVRYFTIYLQGRKGVRGKEASTHTVNNRVRALRAFFSWLHRQGYTECNRLEKVKPPKVRQIETEILTDDEIKSIFDCLDHNTVLGARNTAMFSLMMDTGARLSEVVTLKYDDVHLQERYIKVLGKGNKERIVAFGANCQRPLMHYANQNRIETHGSAADIFFLCEDGHPMSPHGLRSLTRRVAKKAGVLRLHPHLLRHTYATRFLLNGGDVFILKQNLGHTTLAMVEKYVHIASRMAAQLSQGFSPMDRVEMRGTEPFRNSFSGDGRNGRIYSNARRFGKGRSVARNPYRNR